MHEFHMWYLFSFNFKIHSSHPIKVERIALFFFLILLKDERIQLVVVGLFWFILLLDDNVLFCVVYLETWRFLS